jgi:hypothetical protein
MKKILIILIFVFFLIPKIVLATRGCCSYHGGVCGCDTSVGRQVCCDGTYSPSCTCAYIPEQDYTPPPPPQPKFPSETQAKWNFFSNENKTWNIGMEVLDNNPTKYSAVISKCAGCDPGPLVDFYSNKFYFKNTTPGKWYVNVKKEINGYWSNIVYWTIDVPEWQPPTPTATLINNNIDSSYDLGNTNYSYDYKPLVNGVLGLSLGGLVAYFLIKKIG